MIRLKVRKVMVLGDKSELSSDGNGLWYRPVMTGMIKNEELGEKYVDQHVETIIFWTIFRGICGAHPIKTLHFVDTVE